MPQITTKHSNRWIERLAVAKKKCFVIMPFSKTKEYHSEDYWTRHFALYLKPLIEKSGEFEAFRSEPLRGDIATQIITDLTNADIVVADLTDHNPNVLWELGVRQSFKHCTITIAEKGTQIPFHFSHKGVLFYNGEHLDNQLFEGQLLDALRNCIEKQNEPDSPVLEALGGRGTLYSIIHEDENKRKVTALKLEFSFNKELLKKDLEHCQENKTIRDQVKNEDCSMESELLKCAAVENLNVNRYLDMNPEFYSHLFNYYSHVLTINKYLLDWANNGIWNEERMFANKDIFQNVMEILESYLEKIQ